MIKNASEIFSAVTKAMHTSSATIWYKPPEDEVFAWPPMIALVTDECMCDVCWQVEVQTELSKVSQKLADLEYTSNLSCRGIDFWTGV